MSNLAEKFFRGHLIKELSSKVLSVTFTKANGEERVMRCTLQSKYLPESEVSENKRKKNDDIIVVWDVDKDTWRSFRVDSVIAFKEDDTIESITDLLKVLDDELQNYDAESTYDSGFIDGVTFSIQKICELDNYLTRKYE